MMKLGCKHDCISNGHRGSKVIEQANHKQREEEGNFVALDPFVLYNKSRCKYTLATMKLTRLGVSTVS